MTTTADFLYSLVGHVSHQGLPVAGVVVYAYELGTESKAKLANGSGVLIAEQKTGAKGEFTFAVKPGKYKLEIVPQSTTRFLRHSIPEIKVLTNTTLNINLSTGLIVHGTVRRRSGSKLRNCEVVALGIQPSAYKSSAAVDNEGNYHIILPRGKYYLAPRAVLHLQCDKDKDQATPENNDLQQLCFVETDISMLDVYQDNRFDVVLPELVTLTGETVDKEGRSVAGAVATICPVRSAQNSIANELNLFARSVSSSLGQFSVEVQPGLYDVDIEPATGSTLFATRESAVELANDTVKQFVLTDGFQLYGQVMYEHSVLPNCLVRIIGLDNEVDYSLKTDSQGKYSVAVCGGSYKLIVSTQSNGSDGTASGVSTDGIAPWVSKISVAADTEVVVHMQSGIAIKGNLCDDLDKTKPGIKVSVLPYTGKTPRQEQIGSPITSTVTDGDGGYCVFVSPGTYWLVVHKDIANARLVEVGSGEINLDLTFHGWCQLKFKIAGQDGQNVPHCRVVYGPYGRGLDLDLPGEKDVVDRGDVLSDESGFCEIKVPQGVYSFQFHPSDDGSYESKAIRQLSITSNLTRTIELPVKLTSSGQQLRLFS